MPVFEQDVTVSFGDCDPAGIVYYPNFFRWMDGCFHAYLQRRAGGHRAACAALGARGIGLMDARATFRSPASEGDALRYAIERIDWAEKSFDLTYRVACGARVILEGVERRGVFIERKGRLAAGEVAPLKAMLDVAGGA